MELKILLSYKLLRRLSKKQPVSKCRICGVSPYSIDALFCDIHGVHGKHMAIMYRYIGIFGLSALAQLDRDYDTFLLELEKSARDRLLSQDRFIVKDCPLCNFHSDAITLYCGIHGVQWASVKDCRPLCQYLRAGIVSAKGAG